MRQVVCTSAAEINTHKQQNPLPAHCSPSRALPGPALVQPRVTQLFQHWARFCLCWAKARADPPSLGFGSALPAAGGRCFSFNALISFLCSAACVHFTEASAILPVPLGVQSPLPPCGEDGGVWHRQGGGLLLRIAAWRGRLVWAQGSQHRAPQSQQSDLKHIHARSAALCFSWGRCCLLLHVATTEDSRQVFSEVTWPGCSFPIAGNLIRLLESECWCPALQNLPVPSWKPRGSRAACEHGGAGRPAARQGSRQHS